MVQAVEEGQEGCLGDGVGLEGGWVGAGEGACVGAAEGFGYFWWALLSCCLFGVVRMVTEGLRGMTQGRKWVFWGWVVDDCVAIGLNDGGVEVVANELIIEGVEDVANRTS